jgi:hypothetical protein
VSDIRELRWWKSSRSGNQGGNCVEVATTGAIWHLRDSKDRDGGQLTVSSVAWQSFLANVKADR